MITSQRDMILSSVNQATDSSALINLIPFLPLHSLQTCAKQYIEDASQSAINKIYHNVIPLDQIIPPDVIQKILSFNPLSIAQQGVSKLFKELSNTNHLNQITQRNKVIQHPKFNFDIDFQTGTHWIVYPKRQQLTCDDRALEHKEALDLEETFEQCQNEDVLLLYDGEHTISESLFLTKNKALSLIGMSDNVVITIASLRTPIGDIDLESIKLYFNNVHLRGSHSALEIDIDRDAHLWMEQCIVNLSLHITLGIDSSLHVKNCDFKGENQMSTSIVIKVDFEDVGSEVTIVGSTFTGWGSLAHAQETELPCIDIYSCGSDDTIIVEPHITIVGNIFSNNKGRSIVFDSTEMKHSNIPQIEYFLESNVTVHDNISQNKNGRLKDQISPFQKPNPNQIQILYNSDEES
eukprot:722307_1